MNQSKEAIALDARAQARNVVAVASSAMFIGGLALSSVNVAISKIADDIGATATQSSWILLATLLSRNSLMVVFGRLADLTSRRLMFIGGVIVFALGCVLSALAPNGLVLIIGRAATGIGSAMMYATTSALIALAVPRHRIANAMGIYFASNSAAQLLGPVLGGVLADTIGWRWLFWLPVPISLLIMVISFRALPAEVTDKLKSFDVTGALLFIAMTTTFVSTLTTISATGIDQPAVLAGVLVFAVFLALFIWRERSTPDPMVQLLVFRDRLFTGTTATTFLSHIARFGMLILIALIYQSAYGLSATMTSLLVLPIAVGSLVAAPVAGWIEMRKGSAWVSFAGSLVVLVSVLLCGVLIWQPTWYVVVGTGALLIGAGGGAVLNANSSAVTKATPVQSLGVVGSLRVMIQGIGIICGTALVLASVTILLPAEAKKAVYAAHDAALPEATRELLLDGVPITFGVLLVAAIASAVLSRLAYRGYRD